MKKLLSVFLALALCLAILPGKSAQASYEDWYEEVYLYGETRLTGTSYAGRSNIKLALEAIDMLVIEPGEMFSFNDTVGPRTTQMGYRKALNGRGASVVGGGVAQVAATIYLAIKYDDRFPVGDLRTYGNRYNGSYVDSGEDAVITDYSSGIDFTFWNDSSDSVVISLWIDEDADLLCCTVSTDYNYADELVGYASTPLYGTQNKIDNINLCADSIAGITLSPYETFSFNSIVGPRTEEYGYKKALNGRGVNVIGGGVAQVAATIYLAVKYCDCVEILDLHTYGDRFTDGYVQDSRDAVVTDYNAGTDFSFYYTGNRYLRIDVYTDYTEVVCAVYEVDY